MFGATVLTTVSVLVTTLVSTRVSTLTFTITLGLAWPVVLDPEGAGCDGCAPVGALETVWVVGGGAGWALVAGVVEVWVAGGVGLVGGVVAAGGGATALEACPTVPRLVCATAPMPPCALTAATPPCDTPATAELPTPGSAAEVTGAGVALAATVGAEAPLPLPLAPGCLPPGQLDASGAVVEPCGALDPPGVAGGGELEPQPASAAATATQHAAAVTPCGSRIVETGSLWSMSTISAASEQQVVEAVPRGLLIGGEWREGQSGTLTVEDPSTGEPLTDVADASPEDARAALDAAVAAAATWAAHPPRERGEILRRAFEAIVARADELALLMTLEMGKPVVESRAEVIYAAEFLRWFSEEAVRIDGRFGVAPNGRGRLWTMRQPVGPCLLITPWNFPLAMGTRKIGPAVAAGCTMVVKPAQQTPLSMLALAEIFEQAGLPDGVLNVITSSSASATAGPLIADRRLRKLSFTGSTEVGRVLMAQAADGLLRLSMELGGNAPFLVFEDADLDAAVDGAVIAKMRNMGEACTAANRFHVAAPSRRSSRGGWQSACRR